MSKAFQVWQKFVEARLAKVKAVPDWTDLVTISCGPTDHLSVKIGDEERCCMQNVICPTDITIEIHKDGEVAIRVQGKTFPMFP